MAPPKVSLSPIGGGGSPAGALVNPVVQRPNVGGFLQDVAGTLGQVAGVYAQRAEHNRLRRDGLVAEKALAQYTETVAKGFVDFDYLAADAEQRMDEMLDEARQDALESAGSLHPDIAAGLQGRIGKTRTGYKVAFVENQSKTLQEQARQLYAQQVDRGLADVRRDPDNWEAFSLELSQGTRELTVSLPPLEAAKLAEATGDAVLEAVVTGLNLALRFDDATAFLDEHEGKLTPQKVRDLRGRIVAARNQAQQDVEMAARVRYADTEVAIRKNKYGFAELERDKEAGAFAANPQKYAQFYAMIQARNAAAAKEQAYRLELTAKMRGGALETQEEVDDAADMVVEAYMRAHPNAEGADVEDVRVRFAREQGRVPSAERSLLKNAGASENPDALANAARVYEKLRQEAPNVKLDFAGDRVALAAIVQRTVPGKEDFRAAADYVISTAPDAATIKARQDRVAEEFKDFNLDEFLYGGTFSLGGLNPFSERGIFDDDVFVPQQVRDDIGHMAENLFVLTGDKDVTVETMREVVKQRYGVSQAAGTGPRVMRVTPEAVVVGAAAGEFRPDPDLAASVVRNEVEDVLTEAGVFQRGADGTLSSTTMAPLSEVVGPLTVEQYEVAKRQGQIPAWYPPPDANGVVAEPGEETAQWQLTEDETSHRAGRPHRYRVQALSRTFGGIDYWSDVKDPETGDVLYYYPPATADELRANRTYVASAAAKVFDVRQAQREQEATDRRAARSRKKEPAGTAPVQRMGIAGAARGASRPASVPEPDEAAPVPVEELSPVEAQEQLTMVEAAKPQLMQGPVNDPRIPRGIRNNNPFNIDYSASNAWDGKVDKAQNFDSRFEQFKNPLMGLRAGFKLMANHYKGGTFAARKYKRETGRPVNRIRDMVMVMAPPHENKTEAYIAAVAARSGYGADDVLDFTKGQVLLRAGRAMIRQENGQQPYSDRMLLDAIHLAGAP